MDQFHAVQIFLNEEPPDRYTWSGEAADKHASNNKGLIICGQKFCSECQQQVNEKRKSSNGRKLRDICFVDPEDILRYKKP